MRNPAKLRRGIWMPLLIGLMCSILSAFVAMEVLQPLVLVAWYNDKPIAVSVWQVTSYIYTVALGATRLITPMMWLRMPAIAVYDVSGAVHTALHGSDLTRRYCIMLKLISAASVTGFVVSFATTWQLSPKVDKRQHISGRRLIVAGSRVRRFFRRVERSAIRVTGIGLRLSRGLIMSAQRETRHFLLMGATGSGKTVIIKSLLRQIFRRGDRVILIDSKGDYTAGASGPIILLAPHDRRSAIWNVGADVSSELDARELAACFIPPSNDPIWASGAREIFTGLIVALQLSDGVGWSWDDLKLMVFSPLRKIRAMLDRYYPNAAEYLELDADGRPTKIAISFIVELRAHAAGIVIPLAKAWPSSAGRRMFSIKAFLTDEQTTDRTLMLQRASHYPELSTAWMQAFMTLAANYAVSPNLREDNRRRIWFVADEFPQLGKLEKFKQVLEVGRSRGICVILGIQDPHQLQEIYGADAARTWQSSIGTKIICRMEASASADIVRTEIIGKRTVGWTSKSVSTAPWRLDGSGSGATHSRQAQHEEVDVISAAWLESELGWFSSWPAPTIRALIVGVGRGDEQAVLRAEWFIEPWPALRPSTVPAGWTR